MLISKEALLKRLEDRPPDAMIPVAAVRQMIQAEEDAGKYMREDPTLKALDSLRERIKNITGRDPGAEE